MTPAFWSFAGFLLLSAFDALYFHVHKEELGTHAAFQKERALHVQGNLITAGLGIALAWFEWRGWTILVPLALLAGEMLFGLLDYFEEQRVRIPHAPEKALHWAMVFAHTAFALLFLPAAFFWWNSASELVASPGVVRAALTSASLLLVIAALLEARQKPAG